MVPLTERIQARVRTTAVVVQTLVHIVAAVPVGAECGARQAGARASVTTVEIHTRVLTRSVAVAQSALVDICWPGERMGS